MTDWIIIVPNNPSSHYPTIDDPTETYLWWKRTKAEYSNYYIKKYVLPFTKLSYQGEILLVKYKTSIRVFSLKDIHRYDIFIGGLPK